MAIKNLTKVKIKEKVVKLVNFNFKHDFLNLTLLHLKHDIAVIIFPNVLHV